MVWAEYSLFVDVDPQGEADFAKDRGFAFCKRTVSTSSAPKASTQLAPWWTSSVFLLRCLHLLCALSRISVRRHGLRPGIGEQQRHALFEFVCVAQESTPESSKQQTSTPMRYSL